MITFRYKPPAVSPSQAIGALQKLAEHAMAEHLLEASRPHVPRDTGALTESGRTVELPASVAVTYGLDDDGKDGRAPTNDYAVIVHEDMGAAHPNGGAPKYLEGPMHSAAPGMLAEGAIVLRKGCR